MVTADPPNRRADKAHKARKVPTKEKGTAGFDAGGPSQRTDQTAPPPWPVADMPTAGGAPTPVPSVRADDLRLRRLRRSSQVAR